MIIDTNVLLDLLVRSGANNADEFFSTQKQIIITDVVVSETIFVMLGSLYKVTKTSAVAALSRILQLGNVTHKSDVGLKYLDLYANHDLDLADCYLITLAIKTKQPLRTFDRKMHKVYLQEKALAVSLKTKG